MVPDLRSLLNEPPPDSSKENAKHNLRPGTLEGSFRSSIQHAIVSIAKYNPPLALEIAREARAENPHFTALEDLVSPENRAAVELLLHGLLAEDEQGKRSERLLRICVQIRNWRAERLATSLSDK